MKAWIKALSWKSKVFLTALVDGVIGSTFLVIGLKYPEAQQFAQQLWVIWQPLVGYIILIVSGEEIKGAIARLNK